MAQQVDLFVDARTDFSEQFEVRSETGLFLDLSQMTLEAKAGQSHVSSHKLTLETQILPVYGRFNINIPADSLDAYVTYPRIVYDVRAISPEGKIVRIMEGSIFIDQGIA